MKTIVFTKQAAKDLDALPNDDQDFVTTGLTDYAVTGRGDLKALAGREGYRLRIGSFRVIFDEDASMILAIHVGRRQAATYKRNCERIMVNIAPKFIEADGAELVLLTRAEFDRLIAIAEEAEEDAVDIAKYDARKAEIAADENSRLPKEVSVMLLRGVRLIKALRKWRGMTQLHLAHKTGLAQGYISDLESGRRTGTEETLKLIAEKLDVDPSWLV